MKNVIRVFHMSKHYSHLAQPVLRDVEGARSPHNSLCFTGPPEPSTTHNVDQIDNAQEQGNTGLTRYTTGCYHCSAVHGLASVAAAVVFVAEFANPKVHTHRGNQSMKSATLLGLLCVRQKHTTQLTNGRRQNLYDLVVSNL